jgi:Icc-related predicted phosphoesterase
MPRFGGMRRRVQQTPKATRLFFVTDIHGSERCWRKLLNAADFYDVRYLILGGDITGKTMVPIEQTRTGWRAQYNGREYADMSTGERAELEQRIRDNGAYPIHGTREELLALHDETVRDQRFVATVVESIQRWMDIADQRLIGREVRCFVTPGNDDFVEIDAPIEASATVEFVEGRRVELEEPFEMITTGFSNPTPWKTPRELEEDELAHRIREMAAGASHPESLIAVLHAPPYGTELDQAPEIDSEFNLKTTAGQPRLTSVGSTAVGDFIRDCQPLLGLHGHVHDSRGAQSIGRTLCLNPGSEYTEGVLCGALVTLDHREVTTYQFVVG